MGQDSFFHSLILTDGTCSVIALRLNGLDRMGLGTNVS